MQYSNMTLHVHVTRHVTLYNYVKNILHLLFRYIEINGFIHWEFVTQTSAIGDNNSLIKVLLNGMQKSQNGKSTLNSFI